MVAAFAGKSIFVVQKGVSTGPAPAHASARHPANLPEMANGPSVITFISKRLNEASNISRLRCLVLVCRNANQLQKARDAARTQLSKKPLARRLRAAVRTASQCAKSAHRMTRCVVRDASQVHPTPHTW